ncbi:hypothetical protein B0H14DRAFT_3855076 [Mycena olivaceomarginata]|nr:hypothetical protein B0H14DRAFT_3855076 [Mycena olivaceomarginata]
MAEIRAAAQMRVNDFLRKHGELADRIALTVTLVLDPLLNYESDIDEAIFLSLQNDLETLKERTEKEEYQGLLRRHGVLDDVCTGFVLMTEQLQSLHAELDLNLEFPAALLAPNGQLAQAGPGPADREQGGGRTVVSDAVRRVELSGELEPASGPQRGTASIRGARNEANAPPSLRPRLSLPDDCQTFDVMFLPFKSDRSMQLPDPALNAAQLCLQKLGLVFQVKLPRQGYVKRYFDDQVKSFCEDKKIDLQPGVDPDTPLWTFMMVKKRGNNATLRVELLSQREMTAQYLGGREFKLRNYLAEGGDDNILLIVDY